MHNKKTSNKSDKNHGIVGIKISEYIEKKHKTCYNAKCHNNKVGGITIERAYNIITRKNRKSF